MAPSSPYYLYDDEHVIESLQAAWTIVTVRGMYRLPKKRLALLGQAVTKSIMQENWYEARQSRDERLHNTGPGSVGRGE